MSNGILKPNFAATICICRLAKPFKSTMKAAVCEKTIKYLYAMRMFRCELIVLLQQFFLLFSNFAQTYNYT